MLPSIRVPSPFPLRRALAVLGALAVGLSACRPDRIRYGPPIRDTAGVVPPAHRDEGPKAATLAAEPGAPTSRPEKKAP